jgi:hypothetical protein
MFYTGRDRRTRIQNIGLAVSDDLELWTKSPSSPLLQPDPRWYKTGNEESSEAFTWRDPYVVYDPMSTLYYLFLSSHDRFQPEGYQGAIGLAVSRDLYQWTLLPPVLSPGCLRDMEVPTVIRWNNGWYLFVSVKAEWYRPTCPLGDGVTGTLCFRSEKLTGPFELVGHPLLVDHWYAARPVAHGKQWLLLGWRMGEEEGFPHHSLPYSIDNPSRSCGSRLYPLVPVVAMPSTIARCPKRYRTKTGTLTKTAAAMSSLDLFENESGDLFISAATDEAVAIVENFQPTGNWPLRCLN